jgi:hypothetical protein
MNSINSVVGGNFLVGFCDYDHTHDLSYLMKMLYKDEELDRASTLVLKYLHAAVLLKGGAFIKAKQMLKTISGRNPKIPQYAESWLKRNCINWENSIVTFLTPELKEIFDSFLTAP